MHRRAESSEENLSFICDDDQYGCEDDYDLVGLKNRHYVYKESDSGSDNMEASFEQIQHEEHISRMIGEQEDWEQMQILMREEQAKKRRRYWNL